MGEKKIILIAIAAAIYGAVVIGEERLSGFLIIAAIVGSIWAFIEFKKKYDRTKYDHLSGPYKIKISCLKNYKNVYATGKYTATSDGNFDLELLAEEGSDKDIRQEIAHSEWREVQHEVRDYFGKLRS